MYILSTFQSKEKRFTPSHVSPLGTFEGEGKESEITEVNPECLYILSAVPESDEYILAPSQVKPWGLLAGEGNESFITEVNPACL